VQCNNVDISITRVPGHAAAEGSQVLVSWPMQGAGLVVLSECKRKTNRGSSRWEVHQMWSGESGHTSHPSLCGQASTTRLLSAPRRSATNELLNAPIKSQSMLNQ